MPRARSRARELKASWDLRVRRPGRAVPPPPLRPPVRRAAATDQVPEPLSAARGSTARLTVDGERVELAGVAGDDRPQLGRRARRALGVDPGREPGRRGGRATSTWRPGRIKIGPVTTPWVANGMLRIDGVEHRLGGFDRMLSTKVDEQPTELPSSRSRARASSSAAASRRSRATSSPGCTPTRRAPSTTRSTARSPTWSWRSSGTAREPRRLELDRSRRLRDRNARHRPRHPAPALPGRLRPPLSAGYREALVPVEAGPGAHQAQPALERRAGDLEPPREPTTLRLDDPRRVAASSVTLILRQPAARTGR